MNKASYRETFDKIRSELRRESAGQARNELRQAEKAARDVVASGQGEWLSKLTADEFERFEFLLGLAASLHERHGGNPNLRSNRKPFARMLLHQMAWKIPQAELPSYHQALLSAFPEGDETASQGDGERFSFERQVLAEAASLLRAQIRSAVGSALLLNRRRFMASAGAGLLDLKSGGTLSSEVLDLGRRIARWFVSRMPGEIPESEWVDVDVVGDFVGALEQSTPGHALRVYRILDGRMKDELRTDFLDGLTMRLDEAFQLPLAHFAEAHWGRLNTLWQIAMRRAYDEWPEERTGYDEFRQGLEPLHASNAGLLEIDKLASLYSRPLPFGGRTTGPLASERNLGFFIFQELLAKEKPNGRGALFGI